MHIADGNPKCLLVERKWSVRPLLTYRDIAFYSLLDFKAIARRYMCAIRVAARIAIVATDLRAGPYRPVRY
jgi:hypothetical protein